MVFCASAPVPVAARLPLAKAPAIAKTSMLACEFAAILIDPLAVSGEASV